MKEIEGDLIQMALNGDFDIIAHGCNCFCTMNSGIAKTIKETFESAYFADQKTKRGNYNKLGNITLGNYELTNNKFLTILNCYTQYNYGTDEVHLNYIALAMCLNKINFFYKGKKIGLPVIGCGLGGGDWNIVKEIIKKELTDLDVTIVKFKK